MEHGESRVDILERTDGLGFDTTSVYVHDPYHEEDERLFSGKHLRIERGEFRRMKRYGTDVKKSMIIIAPKWLEGPLEDGPPPPPAWRLKRARSRART